MTEQNLEQWLREILTALPVGACCSRIKKENDNSVSASFFAANEEFFRCMGYTQKELEEKGNRLEKLLSFKDEKRMEEKIHDAASHPGSVYIEAFEVPQNDGGTTLVQWSMRCVEKGEETYLFSCCFRPDAYFGTGKQSEKEFWRMEEQYRMLEEISDEFPLDYDVATQQFKIPSRYYRNGKIADRSRKEMKAEEFFRDIHEEDRENCIQTVREASRVEQKGILDCRMNVAPEGEEPVYLWYRTVYRSIADCDGKIKRIIGRCYNINTDKTIQNKLSEEMKRDPLTRLLNKMATQNAVTEFLKREPAGTHVMFVIDIDDFKRINDTFGHAVGDVVLADSAQTIERLFRKMDIVGRVGGDEFLAFMKNVTMEDAATRAKQLCAEVAKRLNGEEESIHVTISIGLAVYGVDGADFATLFEAADRAMYRTKRSGKNSYCFAKGEEYPNVKPTGIGESEERYLRGSEADNEFLIFAFGLLANAKDINVSFHILLERIGKKYGFDIVSVFEYADGRQDKMRMTDSWNRFGRVQEQIVLPDSIQQLSYARPEEFVWVEGESVRKQSLDFWKRWSCEQNGLHHMAVIQFEITGSRSGCLCLGVGEREETFGREEKVMLCKLSRIVSVFISLRNQIRDDQRTIQSLRNPNHTD
ncbi:MAG: diguanylate cyclase domain-containing protein [Roseburia sp.]